ncbi:MAG: acetoacetate--CoA ligase [Burkholderiaceae bacterium]|nr:acetoacetate--CoA ligase [Burkholderiaceae bacterium]
MNPNADKNAETTADSSADSAADTNAAHSAHLHDGDCTSNALPAPYVPQIRLYQDWLFHKRGLQFDSYQALWEWSTTDLEAFWRSIWDYFDLESATPFERVLSHNVMPGAKWFEGASLNYTAQVLRHVRPADQAGMPAFIADNERGERTEMSWPELAHQVRAVATHLQSMGIGMGDRVVAYMPNTPHTAVAFLAVASLGAVWSVCAPDMGTKAVLDRFAQIEPTALIACNGVTYAGKHLDRGDVVNELVQALPTLRHVVQVDTLGRSTTWPQWAGRTCAQWADVIAQHSAAIDAFEPLPVAFDHPLWVVYSSGTTGLPKPIVHGHGGTVIVALQLKTLHNDIGCSYADNSFGERYHWYSSTGWVMWNAQISGLLNGTTCVVFDGSPGGSKEAPDWGVLFRLAARERVTFFGAGAAFFANAMKAGLQVADCGDLSAVRAWGTTGSPLSADTHNWGSAQMANVYARAGVEQTLWWCNISGGTDFAGAFIGGNRELVQVPGQMQCRMLGCAVHAWSDEGQAVVGDVGELVCTQPLPSMPLYFWGDTDGARLLSSYFDSYPPGLGRKPGGGDASPSAGPVWRHGDWLKVGDDGSCVIYGRSDATINRHGLRLGTSEIYAAVEALPQVLDSMVVDLEYLGRDSELILFVVLREGLQLDDGLRGELAGAIRHAVSPRFVPDVMVQAPDIPRTLSGKKQELPIKKMLLGQNLAKVLNPDAMANAACLPWYQAFSDQRGKA